MKVVQGIIAICKYDMDFISKLCGQEPNVNYNLDMRLATTRL